MIDDSRRVSETLGAGQRVDAPFGGTVKDVHASCRAEIERLRAELRMAEKWRDNYKLAFRRATGQAVRGE